MKMELEDRLGEKYAFMKKGKNLNEQLAEGYVDDLFGAFGIEADDGWYELVDRMCADIMKVYQDAGMEPDLVVDQMKEKYGGLRFYYHYEGRTRGIQAFDAPGFSMRITDEKREIDRRITQIVRKAEEDSYTICERCGKPGRLRNELPWIMTLCDECRRKMDKGDESHEQM